MKKPPTIPEAARQAQKELFKLKAVNPALATYYAKKYNKIINGLE